VRRVLIYLLSGGFLFTGVMHFVRTDAFIAIYPDYLPAAREMVYLSGVIEIIGAIGLLMEKTRDAAAVLLALLVVAVFPANVHMAMNAARFRQFPEWLLWLRLLIQPLIIVWLMMAIRPPEEKK
jgi:uncharacterized membrane protein